MNAVLVTGGAGYIGSHAVNALLKAGYRVVVFDNLSRGHRDAVISPDFVEGDLTDINAVRRVFNDYQISAVMHFAAFCYVGESVEEPERYYINNIFGGLNLLSVMREREVKKFIFSSTCAVYGEPEEIPLVESHPRNPVNPYGVTKYLFERALEDYGRAYGLRYVSLRYFNAAGADPGGTLGERHEPETHLIPLVLMAAGGARKGVSIFGDDYPTPDGTCIRDYIHIDDLIRAHLLALDHLAKDGESRVFNLGSESGHSVREVIDVCARVTGKKIPVLVSARRPGDPPVLVASSETLKRELGWKPAYTDLDAIVETAWKFMKKRGTIG